MLENELSRLGFGKNDAKVYLGLIELGKAKAGEIIKYTGLHRNLVYLSLENLEKRELVTKILRKGVAEFSANDPRHLIEELEQQKNIAETIVKEIQQKKEKQTRDVIVYEGEDGIKKSRNFTLQYDADETLYVIGSKASSSAGMEKYWKNYHKKRAQKGIDLKILYERGVTPLDFEWKNKLEKSEAKYLPLDIDFPVWFSIIKDYLEIGIPGDDPLVFGIKSLEAASAFKKFFNYFWNQESITFVGREGVEESYNNLLAFANKTEDVVIFAAKPNDPVLAEFIVSWGQRLSLLCKKIKYIYYGETKENVDWAKVIRSRVPNSEVKIIKTDQSLPISNVVIGNVVSNTVWASTPVCLVTKNKTVAGSLRENFNLLWAQEAQVLKGSEVLKNFWLEGVECKEMRWIGASGYFVDAYPKFFKEIKEKAEKTSGVVWKNIVDESMKAHTLTKLPWMQTKYNLPRSKNPTAIWLFGDKVLLVNWAEGEPVIFCSTNKVLVRSYSDYFDELWNRK